MDPSLLQPGSKDMARSDGPGGDAWRSINLLKGPLPEAHYMHQRGRPRSKGLRPSPKLLLEFMSGGQVLLVFTHLKPDLNLGPSDHLGLDRFVVGSI